MTPCDPPCDECGCCCEAMLPTTLYAMIVTHLLWKELEKHREEMLNNIMDQMTLPPRLIGEVKPGHP